MKEPTKDQQRIQISELHRFVNRYARHDDDCNWVWDHSKCDCGYDTQVRRLRDVLELLHDGYPFSPPDPVSTEAKAG